MSEAGGMQVILIPEHDMPRGMRDLVAEDFARIVHLKGIVVAASKPRIKATSMMLQCKVKCKMPHLLLPFN